MKYLLRAGEKEKKKKKEFDKTGEPVWQVGVELCSNFKKGGGRIYESETQGYDTRLPAEQFADRVQIKEGSSKTHTRSLLCQWHQLETITLSVVPK